MNVRKGFFRLSVVLSVLVGVIAILTTGYRYKIYEVKEEIYYVKPAEAPMPIFTSDKDEADFLAGIYGFDLRGALKKGYSNREIIDHLKQEAKPKPIFTRTMKFEWEEMSRTPTDSDYEKHFPIEKEEKEWVLKERIKDEGFHRNARYIVLGVEDAIRWKKLILRWVLGFSLVWVLYAFIRWVVITFVLGGFKHKT